jgi:hypothetical protein
MGRSVLLVVQSPNLRLAAVESATDAAGWSMQQVMSVGEVADRQLRGDAILCDGLGETGNLVAELTRYPDLAARVFWVGFEVPVSLAVDLRLLSPIDLVASLGEALAEPRDAVDEVTSSAFELDLSGFEEPAEPLSLAEPTERPSLPPEVLDGFAESVVEPDSVAQLEQRLEPEVVGVQIEPIVDLEGAANDFVEGLALDRRFSRSRLFRTLFLLIFGTSAIIVFNYLSWRLSTGPQVSLPVTVGVLPTAKEAVLPAVIPLRPKAAIPPLKPPPRRIAPVLVEKPQKPLRMAIPFDAGRLRPCLDRLGKRSRARLRRNGRLVLKMQLGVMRDGRVGSVVTQSSRIGKARAGGKRFLPCVEGAIAGQQLELRPEVEPTMVLRTFVLRSR